MVGNGAASECGVAGRKPNDGTQMAYREVTQRPLEVDEYGVPLYPPGVVAPAGTYFRDDRPWAPTLVLDQPAVLPAALGGSRVSYLRCDSRASWCSTVR